jgi:GxxExxY protein
MWWSNDPLTQKTIGCAIEVHRQLGPGLLESTYEQCLAYELTQVGLNFEVQCPIPIEYKDIDLNCGYRVDFLVEESLVVEIKAVEHLLRIHEAQVITYIKLADVSAGLLINFNVKLLRDGIRRLFPSPSRYVII